MLYPAELRGRSGLRRIRPTVCNTRDAGLDRFRRRVRRPVPAAGAGRPQAECRRDALRGRGAFAIALRRASSRVAMSSGLRRTV